MSKTLKKADVYCPHLQEVDTGTLNQLFSKVAAVRSENRELFEFTHREIQVFQTTGDQNTVASEDEVYESFDPSDPKNFAVVIEGEVGTGKSELCAYLAHRLKDEGRPLLHVEKEDDLMTLLSERIPEFYREQFGEEMEEAADFQQLRDDISTMPQVVANSAVSNGILNLRQRGYDVSVSDGQQQEIQEYITDKLQLLVEKGKFATKIQFVTEQEYENNDYLQIFSNADTETAVEVYNEELWRVVRGRYNTASLSDVLKRVGKQFEDTRPVIVFEDFAITAMEAGKLAQFIESDQTESAWDFIIAGTRDSTDPLHTRTAESRYEFYQTNKRDSEEVLFLDEDTAVDFVRPYLGYFKSFDGSVRYNRQDGSFELTEAPHGSRCDDCGFCDEDFRDLFPFNPQFLQRIYRGMENRRQSPREYIMLVFDVLSDYYGGKIDAPSDADDLKPLVNRVPVADVVYEDAESFAHLARWYGTHNAAKNVVEVDERFAKAFGLIDASDESDDLSGPIQLVNGVLQIPSTDDFSGRQPEGRQDDDDDEPDDGPQVQQQVDPVQEEFEDKAPLIDSWLNAPSQFKQTQEHLERGVTDALARLTDDYVLYEGTGLTYNLSSQKRPFVFANTEDTPDDDQIVIDPEEFRLSHLRSLLRFGIERDKQPRSAEYDTLLKTTGTQLTAYALDWRDTIRELNLERDNVLYKGRRNYDFADFVLATYSYIILFDSPWHQVTPERICERYDAGEYSINPQVKEWLKEDLEYEEYSSLDTLMENAEYIEEMVGELFGVSGSELNQLEVQGWFESRTPYKVLSRLGRGYIKNVSARVRFKNGPKLRFLADHVYDVQNSLDGLEKQYQEETVEEILETLEEFSMDEYETIVTRLDTYDVDPDLMEPLKQFKQLSQSDVDEAIAAAKMAGDLVEENLFNSIQATLASVKLRHSQVYQRYNAIPSRTGAVADNLGQSFMEVADYYVE